MRKLLIMCTLLFSMVTLAQAQQEGHKMPSPAERAQKSVAQLDKKLTLNEDQKTKINAIYLDQATQITKLHESAGDDKSGLREKMMQINTETDAKVEALLTADQKTAFTTFKEERKAAMKKGGKKEKKNK